MTEYKVTPFSIKVKQSGINAITYSKDTKFVAIGRNNGLVEIYDSSQNYLLIVRIIVSNTNAVNSLEFMIINRSIKLVGVASSIFFVIDCTKNCIESEHILPSNICGRSIALCGDIVAVGCDSGYLCFFNMVENRLVKLINDMEKTIFSLAWSNHFKNFLFVGSVDKLYKVNLLTYDVQYFDVGRESKTSETFIWCAMFSQKNLCTGDSRGKVTIWDAENFGILHSYKTHDIDILSLAAGHNCVYASGTDPTIVTIDLEEHVISTKRYGMLGNVRGLCSFDKSIVAVGSTGDICIYDVIMRFETTETKFTTIDQGYQYEFHDSKIKKSTILFHYTNKLIEVQELSHQSNSKDAVTPLQRVLFSVSAKNKDHIQTWSASEDLTYLAYSTKNETRVLKTNFFLDEADNLTVRVRRFNATDNEANHSGRLVLGKGKGVSLHAASIVKFAKVNDLVYLIIVESSDSSNYMSDDNKCQICIYELKEGEEKPILRSTIISKEDNYFSNIHKLEVSNTGGMIAFSTLDGTVFVYSLESFSVLLKIVREEAAGMLNGARVTTMIFTNTNKRLCVTYTNRKIYDVTINKQIKSGWCHRFNRNMPADWIKSGNVRQMIPVSANKFILLIGKRVIAKLDMDKKIPDLTTPLFRPRIRSQELKLQIIKRELKNTHIKMARLKNIRTNMLQKEQLEDVKKLTRKMEQMEARVKEMQTIELEDESECCFTWHNEKNNLIGLHYIPVGHVIISLSYERIDEERLNYTRKLFGL